MNFQLTNVLSQCTIRAMKLKNLTQGTEKKPALDMRQVRATLILRGDSVHAWARRNDFSPVHVLRSVRGDYSGPKAKRCIDSLKAELGI